MSLCVYDSRACGDSQGELVTFGYKECVDLFFVLVHLTLNYQIKHFLLWGRSIGCNTVLMLQHKLIMSTGRHLNRVMPKKPNTLEYPNQYNVFILKNYNLYIQKNGGTPLADGQRIGFMLVGLVLDVPYYSMHSFIKDNIKRFVPYLPNMLSVTAGNYAIERFNTVHGINLNENQNKFLLSVTNVNTVIIVSDKDEIVPYKRFQKMSKNFASKFKDNVRNPVKTINCGKEHGVKRDDATLEQVFNHLLGVMGPNNVVVHEHIHINNLNDAEARRLVSQLVPVDVAVDGVNQEPADCEEPKKPIDYNPMMMKLQEMPPVDPNAPVSISSLAPKIISMKDVLQESNDNPEKQKIIDFAKNKGAIESSQLPIPGLADSSAVRSSARLPIPGLSDSVGSKNAAKDPFTNLSCRNFASNSAANPKDFQTAP